MHTHKQTHIATHADRAYLPNRSTILLVVREVVLWKAPCVSASLNGALAKQELSCGSSGSTDSKGAVGLLKKGHVWKLTPSTPYLLEDLALLNRSKPLHNELEIKFRILNIVFSSQLGLLDN